MKKSSLSIEVWNTSSGPQYNLVDKNGVIHAMTYDKFHADVILKALSHYVA